jgi:hypothetical protein
MATTVYTTEEITLQDDSKATLKPLNIKALRKFMKTMEGFANANTDEEGFEVLLDASALCVAKERPEFWNAEEGKHTEDYEEAVDMPTIYKILEVCGGVKLNDPNLLAAAAEALGKN